MANSVSSERIREALALDLPYRFSTARERALAEINGVHQKWTQASVLLLLGNPGPSVLITQRTEGVETHKGQMAFPGGMREPGEDEVQTALRETFEEVGVSPESVIELGRLPPLKTPTGFEITPIVGALKIPISEVQLCLSIEEIAQCFWIPLSDLAAPGVYREEILERGALRFPMDVYEIRGHRIWGATGAMLRNFEERLARVGGMP